MATKAAKHGRSRTAADIPTIDGDDTEAVDLMEPQSPGRREGRHGYDGSLFHTPERVELKVAKCHQASVVILLAEHDDGSWRWGCELSRGEVTRGWLPMIDSPGHDSRAKALHDALIDAGNWFAQHATGKAREACLKAIAAMRDKVAAGLNSGRGGRHYVEAQEVSEQLPPGATSTVTPAGIARLDPLAREAADAEPAVEGPSNERGNVFDIPIHLIAPCPWQPRDRPEDSDLDKLTESVRDWGVKQPIVVRRKPGGTPLFPKAAKPPAGKAKGRGIESAVYELIAGERRLRAARAAGLTMIPAMVQNWDDAQAHQFAVVENLQRQDLSQIERARALKTLAERGLTQQAIGRLVGLSQGAVSLLLGCLDLPAEWLDGSIAREITPTHLRALFPYKDVPAVLEEVKGELAQHRKWGHEFPSAKDFPDFVQDAVLNASQPMEGTVVGDSRFNWRAIPIFTPTDEEREQLNIVKVPTGENGQLQERALNVALWEKLQKAHEKQVAASTKAAKNVKGKAAKPKLTAAEEQKRAKERAEQVAKQWDAWRAQWLRYLCWQALEQPAKKGAHQTVVARIMLLAAVKAIRSSDVAMAMQDAGAPKPRGITWPAQRVPKLTADQVAATELALARRLLWDAKERTGGQTDRYPREFIVDATSLEVIAQELGIDLAAAWLREQAGPLSEDFYRLASRQQLVELAEQWECHGRIGPSTTKGALVKLLSTTKCKPLPKIIAPL